MGLNDPQWGEKKVIPVRLIWINYGAISTRNSTACSNVNGRAVGQAAAMDPVRRPRGNMVEASGCSSRLLCSVDCQRILYCE